MKNFVSILLLSLFSCVSSFVLSQFEENKGQIYDDSGKFRDDVFFVSQFSGVNVFFTDKGIVHHYKKIEPAKFEMIKSGQIPNPYNDKEWEEMMFQYSKGEYEGDGFKSKGEEYRIDMTFPGANLNNIVGEKIVLQKNNYFLPNSEVKNVSMYEKIRYINAYPGIDLVFYKESEGLKYDFEVSANSNPSQIKILYKGHQSISLDEDGNAVVKILPGEIVEHAPISFQNDRELKSSFRIKGDTIMFQLGDYDKSQPVRIDPALNWSTYFYDGGTSSAFTNTRPVWDAAGNMFVAMNTYNNTTFPTVNPGGTAYYNISPGANGIQLVIMKFNPSKQIVWATYYPSSQSASVNFSNQCLTIDQNNNIYVVGDLSFPMASPTPAFNLFNPGGGAYYETEIGNGRNFILKFSSAGERLWATMFNKTVSGGSSSGLDLFGLTIDNNNRLLISGRTYTPTSWSVIPLVNPGGAHYYRSSAVESQTPTIHRFNISGGLEWSTYVSQGVADSYCGGYTSIALDQSDNFFMASTASQVFGSGSPTPYTLVNPGGGAYQDGFNTNTNNGRKISIFKFTANGALFWNTLYGGNNSANSVIWQDVRDLTVASNGDVFLAGRVNTTNFPTFDPGGGAFMKTTLSTGSTSVCDGIILQFSNNGVRKWATYYGGNGLSDGTDFWGITKDVNDNITIAGISRTTNTFPIQAKTGSYNQATQNGDYATVLCQFDVNGVSLWSTYFGNQTFFSSGGFNGKDVNVSGGSCGADGAYVLLARNTYPYTVTTVDPGGGAYFQSTPEFTSGSTDIIAEFVDGSAPADNNSTSTATICENQTKSLTSTGAGTGTWSIISGGGSISGTTYTPANITAATNVTIRYTDACANISDITFTVNAQSDSPTSITGTLTICSGNSTTLTLSGGIQGTGATAQWYSGTCGGTLAGTGNSITVSPTLSTTYFVRYEGTCNTTACASQMVTVNTNSVAPTGISGTTSICSGNSTTLTVSGGSAGTGATAQWYVGSCGGTFITTGSSITVAPTNSTTYFVRYSGTCNTTTCASQTVTVTSPPSAGTLSGTQSVCDGSTTTFSSTQTGGSWISSNTGVATVNATSGVITGQSAGTATITYTITGTGGCPNATATRTVTVSAPPSAGTLSGTQSICDGSTTTFSSTQAGGSWTSSNTGVATVNATSGVITGQSVGTSTITYTVTGTGGCPNATATRTVTVSAPPSAGTLSGTQSVCDGLTTTFSSTQAGGSWTSSNTGVATINATSGVITGQSAGTATITYTVTGTGGCPNATATRTVTVDPTPTVTVPNSGNVCVGATLNLSPTTGGTWSSSNTAVATITNAGVVTGVSTGSANVTFTNTTTGCSSTSSAGAINVNPLPTFTVTSSNPTSCGGTDGSITISGLTPSTNYEVSTASGALAPYTSNASGEIILTGLSAGAYSPIEVSLNSCSTVDNATYDLVDPSSPPISVPSGGEVCEGGTLSLSPSTGGTWSSNNTAVATITNGGILTGVSGGSVTVTFTETSSGCTSNPSAGGITVNPSPTLTVPNSGNVCVGATLNLSPTTGGTWSSSNTAVATVTNAGVVTGVSAGTAEMTFTNTTTGCSSNAGTGTITVNPLPTFTVTLSNPGSCGATDGTITISGLNASTNYEVSTASGALTPQTSNAAGEIVLTGLGAGNYSPIEVSLTNCSTVDNGTYELVDPSSPTITVPNGGELCEGESLNLLPNTGGTWSSSDPTVATIDNTGLLTSVSAGTTTVSFTETSSGCTSNASAGSITVHPTPTITVPSGGEICEGEVINLSPSTGGTWSSSAPGVATITNAGEVTGLSSGTADMTFTDATTGCSSTAAAGTITVNAAPVITVPAENEICIGSTLALAPTTGGIWSSSDAGIATITNGGVVTAITSGTADMIFTDTTTGCSSIAATGTIVVNETPLLTTGEINCDKPSGTYSVAYVTDPGATVTSSIGDVTSSAVINIPTGTDVVITSTATGCPSTEQTVSTTECDDVVVDVSNGVSPNSDGRNDFFTISNLDAYPGHSLNIYNRWGDLVYESAPYNNDWSGQNNKGGIGGDQLPAGTYFYILELGEDQEPIKGYIELKR